MLIGLRWKVTAEGCSSSAPNPWDKMLPAQMGLLDAANQSAAIALMKKTLILFFHLWNYYQEP